MYVDPVCGVDADFEVWADGNLHFFAVRNQHVASVQAQVKAGGGEVEGACGVEVAIRGADVAVDVDLSAARGAEFEADVVEFGGVFGDFQAAAFELQAAARDRGADGAAEVEGAVDAAFEFARFGDEVAVFADVGQVEADVAAQVLPAVVADAGVAVDVAVVAHVDGEGALGLFVGEAGGKARGFERQVERRLVFGADGDVAGFELQVGIAPDLATGAAGEVAVAGEGGVERDAGRQVFAEAFRVDFADAVGEFGLFVVFEVEAEAAVLVGEAEVAHGEVFRAELQGGAVLQTQGVVVGGEFEGAEVAAPVVARLRRWFW